MSGASTGLTQHAPATSVTSAAPTPVVAAPSAPALRAATSWLSLACDAEARVFILVGEPNTLSGPCVASAAQSHSRHVTGALCARVRPYALPAARAAGNPPSDSASGTHAQWFGAIA